MTDSTAADVLKPARIRFAPSPTGNLHLGSLRTALYNYLWARRTGGQFILRIEDTDRARLHAGAEESLYENLRWAGLSVDEGPLQGGPHTPYRQSERLDIYRQHIQTLLDNGNAYRCFCPADRLAELKGRARKTGQSGSYDRKCMHVSATEAEERAARGEAHVVRLKTPEKYPVVEDLVHGSVNFLHAPSRARSKATGAAHATDIKFDDPVLIKSDGYPTYHFANVVDDRLMGITHVIRGEEWLPSTPKHLALYAAFGWTPPAFAHVPLLASPGGAKLSKRRGDVTVEDYRRRGFLPEAVNNYLALLGWNASHSHSPSAQGTDGRGAEDIRDEVMDMDEMISRFDLAQITKGAATVTPEKLAFLQKQHYIRLADTGNGIRRHIAQAQKCLQHTYPGERFDDVYVEQVVHALKERLVDPLGLPELGHYFFEPAARLESAEAAKFLRKWRSKHAGKDSADTPAAAAEADAQLRSTLQAVHDLLRDLPPAAWSVAPQLQSDHDGVKSTTETLAVGTFDAAFQKAFDSTEWHTEHAQVLAAIRFALAGGASGAGVKQILAVLGRERSLERLQAAADHVAGLK